MEKILVIEDEQFLREEVVEWLIFEGYEAISAQNGHEGVAFATFHLPDLIICDITMPKLDGYGVLLAVHARPETSDIPFVFLTARATHEDIRKGMDLGADDYITKPFGRLELLRAVKARLAKREIQQEAQQHDLNLLQNAFVNLHERNMLQRKLFSMFSHDFHNPITSIMLTSSLLSNYGEHMEVARRKEHLARIESAAHLLQQMLEDVLFVNQIEKGTLVIQLETVQIGNFLERILHVFAAISGDKCNIVVDCDEDSLIVVDARLLRQITTNLVSNAIKYSTQNSNIYVSLYGQSEQIVLIVRDEGIGIPQEDQAGLFEAFQRGSNVTEIAGSGLGLAIVKQAVDLLGGIIVLESTINIGTTATITLPSPPPIRN